MRGENPTYTSNVDLITFRKKGGKLSVLVLFCRFIDRWSGIFTSGLEIEFLTEFLEVGLGRQFGDSDVDAGPAGGAQVGGTEGQIAQLIVVGEGQLLLHGLDCL